MSVFSYNPGDQDYKIWMVLNPAKYLVPMWIAVLGIAVLVHAVTFSDARYDFLNKPAAVAQSK